MSDPRHGRPELCPTCIDFANGEEANPCYRASCQEVRDAYDAGHAAALRSAPRECELCGSTAGPWTSGGHGSVVCEDSAACDRRAGEQQPSATEPPRGVEGVFADAHLDPIAWCRLMVLAAAGMGGIVEHADRAIAASAVVGLPSSTTRAGGKRP